MIKRKQIGPRISTAIYDQLKQHARLRNTSENVIVETALKLFLSQTEHEAVINRRLNQLQNQVEKLTQEQRIVLETLATFAKVYLAHTPEIPTEKKSAAEENATERFKKFVHLVSDALADKHLFREAIDERVAEARDFAVFGNEGEARAE